MLLNTSSSTVLSDVKSVADLEEEGKHDNSYPHNTGQ